MYSGSEPLVSVIIPVYKVEKYLEECAQSVFNQTYTNLEIIFIDDGSPDRCGEILDGYAKKDFRVRVIHQENRGLSAARNAGLRICTGNYIVFVDSDDWIETNMVEKLIKVSLGSDIDIVFCGFCPVEETKEQVASYEKSRKNELEIATDSELKDQPNTDSVSQKEESVLRYNRREALYYTLNGTIRISMWGGLFNTELFRSGIAFPEGRSYEDIAVIRLLINTANGVCCLEEPLYFYRLHPDSITRTRTIKNIRDRWVSEKEWLDSINPQDEELRKLSIKRCLLAVSYAWRWSYSNGRKQIKEAWPLLEEMSRFARENKKNVNSEEYTLTQRVGVFFGRHLNTHSLWACYMINQCYRRFVNN